MIGTKIKVCIFDVNGVLIDSNAANAEAMARAFTAESAIRERIVQLYLGLTGIDRGSKIRAIQERVIGVPFHEGEFDLRWEQFKDLSRQSMIKAPVTRGSKETLVELGNRAITRVALSNTPLAELDEILASHNLSEYLDIIRGGGDHPKSESLVRLLDEFRFDPAQCLFIGDGKGDLAAARRAAVAFVAIDPGYGEFTNETGLDGPYRDLSDWSEKRIKHEFKNQMDS